MTKEEWVTSRKKVVREAWGFLRTLAHEYGIPLGQWSRENVPKGEPKFKLGDKVKLVSELYVVIVGKDCDGSHLYCLDSIGEESLEGMMTSEPETDEAWPIASSYKHYQCTVSSAHAIRAYGERQQRKGRKEAEQMRFERVPCHPNGVHLGACIGLGPIYRERV